MSELPVTKEMLEGAWVRSAAHYNMGYDEHGEHKGYGYGYRYEDFPRLMFIDRIDQPGDRWSREWYVDGVRVADYDAAVAAVNVPVVLTTEETEALATVPLWFTPLREFEDRLAGCSLPEGGMVMPGTPHSRVMALVSQLRDKGVIEYGRATGPTIRRRS